MDTENLENQSAFITHRDLTRALDKQNMRMDKVEDKVDDLKDLVLPLTVAMNQTAENTKEMAKSFKEFALSQSTTNGTFRDKIHNQDLTIADLKNITGSITEKKKWNAGVVVAIITTAGGIMIAVFQLAPVLAPLLFDK